MTHLLNGGIPNHGFTHWWTMFNPRQLLVNALLLKAIHEVGGDNHRLGDARVCSGSLPAVRAQPEHVHTLEHAG
jgi:hypothetical protein